MNDPILKTQIIKFWRRMNTSESNRGKRSFGRTEGVRGL